MYMRSLWSQPRSIPVSDFLSVQHALRQSMLEEAFKGQAATEGTAPALKVRLDVKEDDKAFYVMADLPGVSQNDIDLTFEEGLLTLKGEKKASRDLTLDSKEKLHLTERSIGNFERQISLGATVDAAKIDASFDKGVLTVVLPKMPEEASKAHKIEIKAS